MQVTSQPRQARKRTCAGNREVGGWVRSSRGEIMSGGREDKALGRGQGFRKRDMEEVPEALCEGLPRTRDFALGPGIIFQRC